MLYEVNKDKSNFYRRSVTQERVKVDAGMHNDLLTIMRKHGPSKEDNSDKLKDIFGSSSSKQLLLRTLAPCDGTQQ